MESRTPRIMQREALPCLLAQSQVKLYHIRWWVLIAANTQAPEEALTADETSQQRQIVKFDLMGPIDLQMKAMLK